MGPEAFRRIALSMAGALEGAHIIQTRSRRRAVHGGGRDRRAYGWRRYLRKLWEKR
jgi:hypothetical protein